MGQEEIEAVAGVLESGWIGMGPRTKEFEEEFARFTGVKFAVGLNSATAALHLAVKALGINSGEIIVPAITFISTALAATYNNAKPVFADVYEDTLNIDVDDIKRKITKKTRAIIPVHYGGHPVELDDILDIANEHDLKMIEDCAHACGSLYKGRHVGSLGDVGCFSFHAVKNLATGDGGMLTTNSEEIAKKVERLRWLGIDKSTFLRSGKDNYSWNYGVAEVGYKYHMNDITAAIGLVQLKKLEKMNERRAEIAGIYNKNFRDIDWIQLPVEKDYVKSAHHNYVVKVNDRDKLMAFLAERGISTGVHYMPLYLHPIYEGIKANTPTVEEIWKKIITLPLYPDMTFNDINKVVNSIKAFKN